VEGYEAIRRTCAPLSAKQVAYLLMESGQWNQHHFKTLDAAAARVRACWSKDKQEYFRVSDLLVIMRRTGNYDVLHFLCDALGLSRPQPVPREHQIAEAFDRLHRLETSVMGALGELKATVGRLSEQDNKPDSVQREGVKFCVIEGGRGGGLKHP